MMNPSPTPKRRRSTTSVTTAEQKQLDAAFRVDTGVDITAFYQTISAKGKAVMELKRRRGEAMHKAPLGYKNARDEHGRSVLVPDPATYALVQEAKRLRAKGMSIRKICAVMTAKGLKSKYGKELGPSSLLKILE